MNLDSNVARRGLLRFARLLAVAAALGGGFVQHAQAYDEKADARADVARAQAAAKAAGKPVLLIFGANWCPDCRALETALAAPDAAAWLARTFEVVKVDVGNFDKHQDVVQAVGNPTKKGIPAAVITDADGTVRFATRAGELASARKMSAEGIVAFLRDAAAQAAARK